VAAVAAVALVAWASAVPSASGEAVPPALPAAPPAGAALASADRPLLGALALLIGPAEAPGSSGGAAGALLPRAHFAFGEVQPATGVVHFVGTPNAVPLTPFAAYQTAVARPAIFPWQTPNAVPGTGLATPGTAVPTLPTAVATLQTAVATLQPAGAQAASRAGTAADAPRAIQPGQVPNAAPRTPLAAYQTAVARPALLPGAPRTAPAPAPLLPGSRP
jgi:hypothetical protein